jgi:Hint domain
MSTEVARTRRNLVKAAALLVGVVATAPMASKRALADHGDDGGGNSGHGGGGGSSACFLRGTRIKTAKGYRRIETLSAGDLLPTRFGGMTPIKQISSFTARTGDANRAVRISRSAFDDNVPAADLVLTAPHAIYADGILVSIGNLANSVTIAYEEIEGEFFHIELETHDVIEAEGMACESLLTDSMTRCAPRLAIDGGRSELKSRLRSAVAVIVDRRTPFDIIRDRVEERSLSL